MDTIERSVHLLLRRTWYGRTFPQGGRGHGRESFRLRGRPARRFADCAFHDVDRAKIRWIEAIAAAGMRDIEVGSFVPPRLIPQMADTAEIVAAARRLPGVTVSPGPEHARRPARGYAAGAHRVSIPVSVSEGHSRANINRAPADQIAEVGRVVAWLREQGATMEVEAALQHGVRLLYGWLGARRGDLSCRGPPC